MPEHFMVVGYVSPGARIEILRVHGTIRPLTEGFWLVKLPCSFLPAHDTYTDVFMGDISADGEVVEIQIRSVSLSLVWKSAQGGAPGCASIHATRLLAQAEQEQEEQEEREARQQAREKARMEGSPVFDYYIL